MQENIEEEETHSISLNMSFLEFNQSSLIKEPFQKRLTGIGGKNGSNLMPYLSDRYRKMNKRFKCRYSCGSELIVSDYDEKEDEGMVTTTAHLCDLDFKKIPSIVTDLVDNLLQLYEKSGTEAPAQLRGMVVSAIMTSPLKDVIRDPATLTKHVNNRYIKLHGGIKPKKSDETLPRKRVKKIKPVIVKVKKTVVVKEKKIKPPPQPKPKPKRLRLEVSESTPSEPSTSYESPAKKPRGRPSINKTKAK